MFNSFVIREIQIQTTRYIFCSSEWQKLERWIIPSVGEDAERQELLCIADGSTIWKAINQYLINDVHACDPSQGCYHLSLLIN